MNALVKALIKPAIRFHTEAYKNGRFDAYCDYLSIYITHQTSCEFDPVYGGFKAQTHIQKVELIVSNDLDIDATAFFSANDVLFDSLRKFIGDEAIHAEMQQQADRYQAMTDCDHYDAAEAGTRYAH